jgi:spore coat polysaccharide biosynthesis protein SpsF
MNAALILARIDSKRLPNKAIKNVGGKKLIQWCIDGILNTKSLEPVLVTTDRPVDDPLIEVAKQNNIKYFRGSTYNIAKRIYDCINFFNIDIFARINGDSPFVNQKLISEALEILKKNPDIEFVTNLVPRRFPYGLSVEMLRSSVYKKHYSKINTPEFQEHITSWFYQNPDQVKIFKLNYKNGNDHHLRFVVDTYDDRDNIENFILENPSFDFHNAPLKELVKRYKNTITI